MFTTTVLTVIRPLRLYVTTLLPPTIMALFTASCIIYLFIYCLFVAGNFFTFSLYAVARNLRDGLTGGQSVSLLGQSRSDLKDRF